MPEEFDPAWEYYTGDPEVEELLGLVSEVDGFDGLKDYRQIYRDVNPGLRFGNKPRDIDRCLFKLGREKKGRPESTCHVVSCRTCGYRFMQDRIGRKYCSMDCTPHPGRPRERPTSVSCRVCNQLFEPMYKAQKCCSRRCASTLSINAPRVRVYKKKVRSPEVCQLPGCGVVFIPKAKGQRFCGPACVGKHAKPVMDFTPFRVGCEGCGKDPGFKNNPKGKTTIPKRFCSDRCKSKVFYHTVKHGQRQGVDGRGGSQSCGHDVTAGSVQGDCEGVREDVDGGLPTVDQDQEGEARVTPPV